MAKPFDFSDATAKIIRAKGDCCWACGVPGWFGIEIDHIIPRNHPDCHTGENNGQMLCSTCNNIKADVTIAAKVRPNGVWANSEKKMVQIITKNRMEWRKAVNVARKQQKIAA